jgi:hypothetical protein
MSNILRVHHPPKLKKKVLSTLLLQMPGSKYRVTMGEYQNKFDHWTMAASVN